MLSLLASLVITAAAGVAFHAIAAALVEGWPRIAEVLKDPGRSVGAVHAVPTPFLRQRRDDAHRPSAGPVVLRRAA